MEKIENQTRSYFLNSDRIVWDSIRQNWRIENYFVRHVNGIHETIEKGFSKDTTLNMHPSDFKRRVTIIKSMDTPKLNKFIQEEEMEGSSNVNTYLVEKYQRIAVPFATFILTLIGVSLSSRKARGGIGGQLGAGIFISFTYILFMQISNTFAINGLLPPIIAVWIPDIVFTGIAFFLLRYAPK